MYIANNVPQNKVSAGCRRILFLIVFLSIFFKGPTQFAHLTEVFQYYPNYPSLTQSWTNRHPFEIVV